MTSPAPIALNAVPGAGSSERNTRVTSGVELCNPQPDEKLVSDTHALG